MPSSDMMQSAQFMGLINALRTGDPTIDTIGAFLLPFVFQRVATHIPGEVKKLYQWIFEPGDSHKSFQRTIEYRTVSNSLGETKSDEDALNMCLVRAINLYVHRHCDLGQLRNAKLKLSMLSNSRISSNPVSAALSYQNKRPESTHETLKKCDLVEKPLEDRWIDVGEYDGERVKMWSFETVPLTTDGKESSNNIRTRGVHLRSSSPRGIHVFTRTAVDWYANELQAEEDKDRFFFDFQYAADSRSRPKHTPYKLNDGKTFKTLFSHKCHSLLPIVDHFQNKTGKVRG